jgi:sn-glycerol 3-phosphate transport system ATP-binding protein
MADLELRKVVKRFGAAEVIHGVDLRIEDGEFVVFVGPSGCGKSTLLRMIAGLESITSGEIRIGGRVVNDLEPADRDIAMVFQNYALYPHMTVRQNLEYGLKNRKTPRPEIDRRVTEAARALEIGPLLDRKPRQLSGGQRQRVAMGRAIVREPAAFLFDEPLSNLDAKLRVQMRIEIRRLQRAFDTTSVYVTHDQLEAMTLADSLVVLNAGKVEQRGTPIDLYEKPESLFVAGFIGSPGMNLIPTTRTSGGISAPGLEITAPLPADGEYTVGIRPEDLVLASPGETVNGLRATTTVTAVELVGAESYVHGEMDGGGDLVYRIPGRTKLTPGERLTVAAPASAMHLFDSDGARVAAAYTV